MTASIALHPSSLLGCDLRRMALSLLLMLCAGLVAVPVRAQELVHPVLPLEEVLRDADGDAVPDRDGHVVTTGGRAISGVMGQEDDVKDFFVQSGLTGVDVVIPEGVPAPALGDSVMVTGTVAFDGGTVLLVASAFRVVPGPPSVPAPVSLTGRGAKALKANRGRLVVMEGTVVGQSRAHGGASLLLYPDGGDAVTVFVSSGRVDEFDFGPFAPGSRLRVTGVLGQYDETAPYDEGFILYPRSQEDLRRVGLPAAFYQRALGGGFVLVLLTAVWVATLRRQVRRRTSALRESEEALREYARELEAAKERAEEARCRAEEMLRLKSAFLNNMSHEIRTPLTGILGYADVLAEEVAEEHREFIDIITGSARRLMDTLNSVLDLAQLESRTVLLDLQPVDVLAAAEETLALLRPLAEEKGLAVELGGAPAVALTDRAAFHRVLVNLVGNAVKFTERGAVTVEVGADGERVCLRVADTGVGISPEFLPHLFEEFKQESEGYARTHEGSGLGLTITRRLVELMGGAVGVESAPGEGSAFTVTLPCATPAGVLAGDGGARAARLGAPPRGGSGHNGDREQHGNRT